MSHLMPVIHGMAAGRHLTLAGKTYKCPSAAVKFSPESFHLIYICSVSRTI
ncbi:hypothetical protein DAI22_04g044350 [Oryza sativa Japonica Group]|nr:hypothetical protein DAI22_04g044350 [Oryza sativa Japonica Group]